MFNNLPAIDARRRLRLWDRKTFECLDDVRVEDDETPLSIAQDLMVGRVDAVATVDQANWDERLTCFLYRGEDRRIEVLFPDDFKRLLEWPVPDTNQEKPAK